MAVADDPTVALAGNPNSGKTTLFNQLTGARHRIANYPGVTVSHTMGVYRTDGGRQYQVVDLPGAYSLDAHSPDEEIAQRFILGDGNGTPPTDLICVVLDATNLERNLFLASQLAELSLPTVVALNMMDLAEQQALDIDIDGLAEQLGVPVVPIVASDRASLGALELSFHNALSVGAGVLRWGRRPFRLDPAIERAVEELAEAVLAAEPGLNTGEADFLARKLLGGSTTDRCRALLAHPDIARRVEDFAEAHPDVDVIELDIQARYAWLRSVLPVVLIRPERRVTWTDRLDRWALHRVTGPLVLLSVFALVFMAVFFLAAYPMDLVDGAKGWLAGAVAATMGPGELQSLLTNGIIEGVGAVLVFVPQIILLFLLIAFLEDFGYMARAAFILDRVLSRVGLSGRAFIPLLSSFACAIPGILATRSIPSRRERFLTIMVAPLMVCSARLPVYSLLIAAFIVPTYGAAAGGLVFLGLYVLGIVTAGVVALLFGRTILKGGQEPLILELPAYRRPVWRNIATTAWERSWDFVRSAGTIILSVTIVLWFLAAHPGNEAAAARVEATEAQLSEVTQAADSGDASAQARASELHAELGAARLSELESSFAGRIGKLMEPVIEPLGFDWKIGVGLLTSFAAREVFVGTMSTMYGLTDSGDGDRRLAARLQNDRHADGSPRYGLLMALSLLVFYAFACQCMSTVAVVARETRSWRWPLFMFGYMAALAFAAAFIVYNGGKLLGLG